MNYEQIQKTLEAIRAGELGILKATLSAPANADSGLQLYNLEAPAKTLVPRITPLRNSIPRINDGYATEAKWKAVTAINSGKVTAGIPEGKRNKQIVLTQRNYNAVFKTYGMEASSTFQAVWAGKGFEDIRARARRSGLHAIFVEEERLILGGNTSNTGIALGVPTAPSGVAATGGTMTARTVVARVVLLTLEGYRQSDRVDLTIGVATTESRTPADGGAAYAVKLGSSNKSAESAGVVVAAGGDKKVTWTLTAQRGAIAYAIYSGVAGTTRLVGYTTTTEFVQLADEAVGSQNSSAITADNSQDEYAFDGLLTQIMKSGNEGYWLSLANGTLTADTRGGITQFDDFLIDRWNDHKVTSFEIYLNANHQKDVSDKIRVGSAATPFSINVTDGKADIVGGGRAIGYTHPLTGEFLPFRVHPDLPDGTIAFKGLEVPYEDDRIPNVWQMKMRQEYLSIEWPLRTLEYEVAVIADGVLQGYAPFANGVLSAVKRG